MRSIRPLIAIVVFVVCALLLLNQGRHHGAAPVLVPAEAMPSAPKQLHVSRAAERKEAAFERHSVQRQMVKFIHGLDRGLVHPKTLASLACTKSSADPPLLRRDGGVRFNCVATYTSGQRQGWCVAYQPALDLVTTDFEGVRMCEGRPDPMIEP
jgi:hypothetical protein